MPCAWDRRRQAAAGSSNFGVAGDEPGEVGGGGRSCFSIKLRETRYCRMGMPFLGWPPPFPQLQLPANDAWRQATAAAAVRPRQLHACPDRSIPTERLRRIDRWTLSAGKSFLLRGSLPSAHCCPSAASPFISVNHTRSIHYFEAERAPEPHSPRRQQCEARRRASVEAAAVTAPSPRCKDPLRPPTDAPLAVPACRCRRQ